MTDSTDFDEKTEMANEFAALAKTDQQLVQKYSEVENALNNGQISLEEGNHYRLELRGWAEKGRARMAQLQGGMVEARNKEVSALRKEIPGWESDAGFKQGSKTLKKFAKDEGYPDTWLGTASPKQLRDMEELRQRRNLGNMSELGKKREAVDFDLADIAKSQGRKYKPDATNWDAMSERSGIPVESLKSMKRSDRDFMTQDLDVDVPLERKQNR